MHHDHAARAQHPDGLVDERREVYQRTVDEHEVVGAVGQSRQYLSRRAVDQPGPAGRDVGACERRACGAVVFGFGVDGGEDPVARHSVEKPEATHPGAGADLGNGVCVARAGEQRQQCTHCRADWFGPQFVCACPRGGQRIVFDDRRFGVVDQGRGRGIGTGGCIGHSMRLGRTRPAMSVARPIRVLTEVDES
ncbi:Uncharacterised protein [Mycobacteroides abscessus subsp. abscessus]|nr:Uncharacterised protein [Mycobacteroides abscessus subsp. abscessus]